MAQEIDKASGDCLNNRQITFVEAVDRGDSDAEALAAAGYADAQNLGSLAASPAVQGALKARRVARITGTLAQRALKTIEKMIEDDRTPAATRFAASKWVLEQAGHSGAQDDSKDKPLHEMSEAELLAFMQRAQKVIEQGGEPPVITVTPAAGVTSASHP